MSTRGKPSLQYIEQQTQKSQELARSGKQVQLRLRWAKPPQQCHRQTRSLSLAILHANTNPQQP